MKVKLWDTGITKIWKANKSNIIGTYLYTLTQVPNFPESKIISLTSVLPNNTANRIKKVIDEHIKVSFMVFINTKRAF